VFAARGYHASSLREVSTVAEMSLSNLMHHFPTKESLLLALLEQRDADGVGLGSSDSGGGRDEFLGHVVAQARANENIPGLIALYSVLSAESTTTGHPGRDYFVDRFSMLRDEYTGEFERLRDAGRLREGVDPRLAAGTLVALWDGIQLQWLLQPDEVNVAEHLRAFLDLVVVP